MLELIAYTLLVTVLLYVTYLIGAGIGRRWKASANRKKREG
jgi:hypothetical protein